MSAFSIESAARKRCSKFEPRAEVLELRLHHRAQVARRVVAELDRRGTAALEDEDHAAADLRGWHCHKNVLTPDGLNFLLSVARENRHSRDREVGTDFRKPRSLASGPAFCPAEQKARRLSGAIKEQPPDFQSALCRTVGTARSNHVHVIHRVAPGFVGGALQLEEDAECDLIFETSFL